MLEQPLVAAADEVHAPVLRAHRMKRCPARYAAVAQRTAPIAFILMPRRRCADSRRLSQELLVPEFHLLLHQQTAEARGPRAERRCHEPRIVPIDCALHDTVGALLQRLAFAPVPILGLGVQRALDHLVPHAHERGQFLRIDRVLDDEEAVFVEALQLFGGGIHHPPRIATRPHLANASGSNATASRTASLRGSPASR